MISCLLAGERSEAHPVARCGELALAHVAHERVRGPIAEDESLVVREGEEGGGHRAGLSRDDALGGRRLTTHRASRVGRRGRRRERGRRRRRKRRRRKERQSRHPNTVDMFLRLVSLSVSIVIAIDVMVVVVVVDDDDNFIVVIIVVIIVFIVIKRRAHGLGFVRFVGEVIGIVVVGGMGMCRVGRGGGDDVAETARAPEMSEAMSEAQIGRAHV